MYTALLASSQGFVPDLARRLTLADTGLNLGTLFLLALKPASHILQSHLPTAMNLCARTHTALAPEAFTVLTACVHS